MTEIVKVHAVRDHIEIWVTAFDGTQEVSTHPVIPDGGTARWWVRDLPPVPVPATPA